MGYRLEPARACDGLSLGFNFMTMSYLQGWIWVRLRAPPRHESHGSARASLFNSFNTLK